MKSENLRLSNIRRRKTLYLAKRYRKKELSSYCSNSSSVVTSDSIYDSSDDLVCTNCVETDYYLAQFCNELLYSPSSAIQHLEGLINNPEFPKGDLYLSEMEWTQAPQSLSVPVTTSTCTDCNPHDERIPPKQINIPTSHSQVVCPRAPKSSNFSYEKQRREMERDLIKAIYELVCDQQVTGPRAPPPSARITKLQVSEMAIQRMMNIQKINYSSQIERIKYKLLQSYRAFSRLDGFVRKAGGTLIGTVPHSRKIRDLERALHIHS